MTPLNSVGDRVPAFLLKSAVQAAMAAAGNGRGTFVWSYDIDVQFTILSDRTDVRVVGLGDHAECELRAVGDTLFRRIAFWEYEPDGGVSAHLQWTHETRDASMYGPGVADIGTPMGLINGISDSQDAVVIAGDPTTTTYRVAIATSAIQRALAENTTGEGYEVDDPTRVCLVVVNERGLPVSISPRDQDYPFAFSDWGVTSPVLPPDEPSTHWTEVRY